MIILLHYSCAFVVVSYLGTSIAIFRHAEYYLGNASFSTWLAKPIGSFGDQLAVCNVSYIAHNVLMENAWELSKPLGKLLRSFRNPIGP